LAVFVVAAWAQCDFGTCLVCQQNPGCNWYGKDSFSDCRLNSSVPASLDLPIISSCPLCQAGSCSDCMNQGNCTWYTSSNGAFGGQCGAITTTPTSPFTTYTAASVCPICNTFSNCTACNDNQDSTNNCGWYVIAGGAGKCREASPGFAYTKVAVGFCDGNICAASSTCSGCANVTVNDTSVCAWYTSKSPPLYNSKCDVNKTGVVSSTFYNPAPSCPACAGTTCVSCKAEAGCQWLAVSVLGVTSFGQCALSNASVTGKTSIATCPATCKIYSCTECVKIPECRWFTGSPIQSDGCDRASDAGQYISSTALSDAGKCPACKDTRCFECNSESGCGWYRNVVPGTGLVVPGTGDCFSTTGSLTNQKLLPSTDPKCDGSPSSASALVPGLAMLLVSFMYHN